MLLSFIDNKGPPVMRDDHGHATTMTIRVQGAMSMATWQPINEWWWCHRSLLLFTYYCNGKYFTFIPTHLLMVPCYSNYNDWHDVTPPQCNATTRRCHHGECLAMVTKWRMATLLPFIVVAVRCCRLFREWRSLASRCSQCNVVSLHINFIYCRNNSQSTTYPPNPVQTGWDWSFNHRKLTKTTLNWLMSVQSSFSRFVDLWGLVQVSVLSKFDKRLDWTRLPSTKYKLSSTLRTSEHKIALEL